MYKLYIIIYKLYINNINYNYKNITYIYKNSIEILCMLTLICFDIFNLIRRRIFILYYVM